MVTVRSVLGSRLVERQRTPLEASTAITVPASLVQSRPSPSDTVWLSFRVTPTPVPARLSW